MKHKTTAENTSPNDDTHDDMRPEYDFSSGGVRGRYAKTLREQGYSVRVYNDDGTYSERRVLGEQTVVLEPDVREYFPDSEAVNRALRSLIALIPQKTKTLPNRPQNHWAGTTASGCLW